jgi:NADPH:quinone reductase-like Zn-dependent oxidoreductase
MRAAVVTRYGPPEVVEVQERPDPVVGADEVLIRARATTVDSGDARVRGLDVPRGMTSLVRLKLGFTKPKQPILGFDVAGEVQAVGADVTRFHPGDRVLASRTFDFGCHAELVGVAEDGALARIPEGLTTEHAAALLFGGTTSLHFLRLADLRPGERLLVNGASGAVGTLAVQLAKHLGAEVTGVCSSGNADLVRSIGADHVITYDTTDFTADGQQYDVIMDNHGNAPYSRIKRSLAPGGRFLLIIGDLFQMAAATWQKATIGGGDNDDAITGPRLEELLALAEHGAVRPVIDSTFPFEHIVEAHRRVDTGHKVGSVVVTFSDP